jgi:hypothetical protein
MYAPQGNKVTAKSRLIDFDSVITCRPLFTKLLERFSRFVGRLFRQGLNQKSLHVKGRKGLSDCRTMPRRTNFPGAKRSVILSGLTRGLAICLNLWSDGRGEKVCHFVSLTRGLASCRGSHERSGQLSRVVVFVAGSRILREVWSVV